MKIVGLHLINCRDRDGRRSCYGFRQCVVDDCQISYVAQNIMGLVLVVFWMIHQRHKWL